MLIPCEDRTLYYHDVKVRNYEAFLNSRLQIVEIILTEDGEQFIEKTELDDLNDIEKYYVQKRGLDIVAVKARRKAELETAHEAEIIQFPLIS